MALFIGNQRVVITSGNENYNLNFYVYTPITNGVPLLSSDGMLLQDTNGLYLTVKEDE